MGTRTNADHDVPGAPAGHFLLEQLARRSVIHAPSHDEGMFGSEVTKPGHYKRSFATLIEFITVTVKVREPLTARDLARTALERHLGERDWSTQSPSRRRILSTFLQLAAAKGFDAVTMRMIAQEIGIKAPSIYAHFPDGKDEIVAESLSWHFHNFGTALLQAVDPDQSPDEYWDAMVRLHFVRQLTLPESNLWDLLVQTDRMAKIFPEDLRSQVAHWVQLHEDMYVGAAQDLEVSDPVRRVRLVIALLESTTRWSDPSDDLDAASARAIEISRRILGLPIVQRSGPRQKPD